MKSGWIVWNQTSYGTGFEFYGVYRKRQDAEKALRRWLRERYGVGPRGSELEMLDRLREISKEFRENEEDGDDYQISPFPSEGER